MPESPRVQKNLVAAPNENDDKGTQEANWYDKPTDWLLALFTGILALYTRRLYQATVGLFSETAELRRIADEQRKDLSRSITAAEKSAEAAERTLIAANRPWVRPQVIKVDPIIITEKKLSFGITLQFINTGKSPACNVDYFQDFVSLGYPRLSIRQDDMCKAAEMFSAQTDEKLQKHFTIFPNESGNMTFGFPFETSDVDKFNLRVGAPNDPNPIFWIAPILIGCVAYRWDGRPKYHHTMFSFEFGKASPDGGFMRITSGAQVIDATDVRVRPAFLARNTAD